MTLSQLLSLMQQHIIPISLILQEIEDRKTQERIEKSFVKKELSQQEKFKLWMEGKI